MEDWVFYATISVFSWKLSIKLAETLKFHYRTPILSLVLQKQKTIFFHCYEDIIEHSNRQYRSTFRFEFPRKTTKEVSDMCKTWQQEKRNWTILWDYNNS